MPTSAPVSSACLEGLRAALTRLVGHNQRVVVAASGGPDSQALLDGIGRLKACMALTPLVVGVDHGLRTQAAAELACAADLSKSHALPFHLEKLGPLPAGNRLSEARKARYRVLAACAQRHRAQAILLGHNLDDQAETVLLHLVRGTGSAGWGGMSERRGLLVRPLLQISRAQILEHLLATEVPYAQDPSNMDMARARAQLRHSVMPALQRLNPQALRHIAQSATQARMEHAMWASVIRRLLNRRLTTASQALLTKPLSRLAEPLAARVVFAWLQRQQAQPDRAAVTRVLKLAKVSSRSPCCVRGGFVVRRGEALAYVAGRPHRALPSASSSWSPVRFQRPTLVQHDGLRLRCGAAQLSLTPADMCAATRPWTHSTDATAVAFDADRLHVELLLRPWRPGDKIQPFGLNGRTLVADIFNQHRVPQSLRARWPVLESDGEILWVCGLRRGAFAPLGPKTQSVLCLRTDFLPAPTSFPPTSASIGLDQP